MEGGVHASAFSLRAARARGFPASRVTVEDSGTGVSPAVRDLIFATFTQADQSMTRSHGGIGLGLALVRRLVELQGGRLGLEPRAGGGSAFWVELPAPLDG